MTSLPPPDPKDAPSGGTVRALAELTKDMRRARPPEVDFDRMEQELFAKLDAEPSRLSPPARRGLGVLPVVAGVLAVAAGSLFFLRSAPPSPTVAPTPVLATQVTPASPPATRVETADAPRHFEQAGLASWTLAAGSRATVVQTATLVTVTLDEGAIDVDVIPQPVAERFVVLVDHARVAVHGTRFRVARSASGVDVDVAHGTVAVSSLEAAGQPPRWLLPAPIGGTFSLSGAEGSLRPLQPFGDDGVKAAVTPPSRTKPVATPRSSSAARAPDPAAVPPAEVTVPMLSPVALGARAQEAVERCFWKNAKLSAGVHVQVSTSLSLQADGQGALTATFDPPLAPPVESCFRDAMTGVRAPAGTYEVPLRLVDR